MYLLIFNLIGDSNSRFKTIVNPIIAMKIIYNPIRIIDNFWSQLIKKRTEPEVWQKCDRQGNNYWLTFDPITGSYSYFCSEQEVKMWIEKRYYAHAK